MNFANLRKTSRNRNLHIKCTVRGRGRQGEKKMGRGKGKGAQWSQHNFIISKRKLCGMRMPQESDSIKIKHI